MFCLQNWCRYELFLMKQLTEKRMRGDDSKILRMGILDDREDSELPVFLKAIEKRITEVNY